MKKSVLITIISRHSEDAKENDMDVQLMGSYMENGDKFYLFYEEKSEDGQISKCRIKYEENVVELNRDGASRTQMVFKEGERYESAYHTAMGTFDMMIDTKKVVLQREKDPILKMTFIYDLYLNEQFIAENTMTVIAKEI